MKEQVTLPPALAAAIARDLAPVRPFFSASRRTLIVAAIAAAAGALLVATYGLARADAPLIALVSIALRLALGAALSFVALREGVPSDGLSSRARSVAAALGVAGLIVLPLLQSRSGVAFAAHDSHCYWLVLLTAAPAVAVMVWLLARAYPIRTVSAMALGSLGVAYLADLAASLVCAERNLEHALLFHGGAVVTLAMMGVGMGVAMRRIKWRW